MSYQVLARKWRPHSFKDLVGQEHVVQALVNGLDQDRVHHAFLLTGTRGVGKTTIARILAKCLNCERGVSSTPCGVCGSCIDVDEGRFIDMMEIDAASKTKVDDTRELLETVQYTPNRGRYKVYIIDEVHMLSGHSFNALLKTLEEPPPHVKFVLATTDPQKLPITILSRCLRFSLTRLLPDQIGTHIENILQTESIEADQSAIMRIARAADGSMRDGLSLLDQAIAFGGGSLKDADVASMLGSIDHVHVSTMIDALSNGDAKALLDIVNDLVMQSRNLESALDELAEAMHRIALIHAAPGFRDPERADWESLIEHAARISPEDAQLYYQIAITGRRDLGLAPDPRTGLEMTLLRMLAFRPAETGSGEISAAAKSPIAGTGAGSKDAVGTAVSKAGAINTAAINIGEANTSKANTGKANTSKANTGTVVDNSDKAVLPARDKTTGGGSDAAKAARAAFDALQKSASTVKPKPRVPEPEFKFDPEPEPEPELNFDSRPETELKNESRSKIAPAPELEPEIEVEPASTTSNEVSEQDWAGLQKNLELSGATRELARQLQLEAVDGTHWKFLAPDTLHLLGSESVVQNLQAALVKYLGHPVKLDLHTASEPVKSVATASEHAEINRKSEAERSIEEDPTVQDIKSKFGAKIVPDSIQPLQ